MDSCVDKIIIDSYHQKSTCLDIKQKQQNYISLRRASYTADSYVFECIWDCLIKGFKPAICVRLSQYIVFWCCFCFVCLCYVYCAPCCLCVLTPYDLDGQKFHDMTQRVSSKKRERYNIIRLNNKYTTKSNRKSQKQG